MVIYTSLQVAEGANPEDPSATKKVFHNSQNVIGHIDGIDNSKVVVISAHYDTVPFSPGAEYVCIFKFVNPLMLTTCNLPVTMLQPLRW